MNIIIPNINVRSLDSFPMMLSSVRHIMAIIGVVRVVRINLFSVVLRYPWFEMKCVVPGPYFPYILVKAMSKITEDSCLELVQRISKHPVCIYSS
jgi:hypothetical protein